MMMLLWGCVVVSLQIALLVWIFRRRRLGTIFDSIDETTKREFSHAMMWAMLAGIFWGSSFWTGNLLAKVTVPQAAFVPVMLGQICAMFAARPPLRR